MAASRTREADNQKDNGAEGEDEVTEFPRFENLPVEIQKVIWQHALPRPWNIPDSILVFVNFNLSKPRAILPPSRYIAGLYKDIERRNGCPSLTSVLMGDTQVWDLSLRDTMISLLHTCQNSKSAAAEMFSLDAVESKEEWNTNLWGPGADTLYLAGLAYSNIECGHIFLRWLTDRRE